MPIHCFEVARGTVSIVACLGLGTNHRAKLNYSTRELLTNTFSQLSLFSSMNFW